MIYVTHNMTEVLTLADWVLMIRQGRLIAQGIPREVLRSTYAIAQMEEEQIENVFTVVLVESDPQAGRSTVRLESGRELFIPYLAQPQNRFLQIRISADDILVGTQRPEGISAGNVLAGIVQHIEWLKAQALLRVDAGDLFYVRLTASAVARLSLTEGSSVFLIMKSRSFRLL
jgi:molybdate transport system ATP-binding protein